MTPATTLSTRLARVVSATIVAGAAVLALPACTDRAGNEVTRTDVDAAAAKTRDAAVAAGRKAADLAEKARDQTVEFAKSPKVRQEAAEAKEAIRDAMTPSPAPASPAPPPARP
jgi:hyperosmotically inducible periplasmic protein